MNRKLRKAILASLGTAALAGMSTQANAWTASDVGTFTGANTLSTTFNNAFKSWADYGAGNNLSWAHTAKWMKVQVGTAAQIAAGATLDTRITITGTNTATGVNPPNTSQFSGFTMWTTGNSAVVDGAGQHSYAQILGPGEGPQVKMPLANGASGIIVDYPNYTLNDLTGPGGTSTGNATQSSNVLLGHNGWVGYAQNGVTFNSGTLNGGSPVTFGTVYSGTSGGSQATINTTAGSAIGNTVSSKVWEDSGTRTVGLDLYGLKAGYYLFQAGGVCPDNSPTCMTGGAPGTAGGTYAGPLPGSNSRGMTFTVSAVPVPAAVWLFGSALAGMGIIGRRKDKKAIA